MNQFEYNRVLQVYDKQIQRGNFQSQIDQELFILSQQLTLQDWKIIRSGSYYKKLYSLKSSTDQSIFILDKIKFYLNEIESSGP